jgi:hypothetical protein
MFETNPVKFHSPFFLTQRGRDGKVLTHWKLISFKRPAGRSNPEFTGNWEWLQELLSL